MQAALCCHSSTTDAQAPHALLLLPDMALCLPLLQDAPCDFKTFADQQNKQSRTDTTTNPSYSNAHPDAAAAPGDYGVKSAPYQDQAYAPPQQQQQQFGQFGGDAEAPAAPMCNCNEPAAMKTSRWVHQVPAAILPGP